MTNTAFEIFGADRPSRWLVTCDHAANTVPSSINNGDLGLPESEMNRHIAYDLGAAAVTRALAERLNGPAVLSKFSRLVIDPNRGEDDPTLVMQLYDGTIIPGNRHLSAQDIAHRRDTYYLPYHDAVAGLAARQDDTLYVAIHSFSPKLNGRQPRPWQIGLLFADDERLARPLLDILNREDDLCVGENEPYAGHLPGDAVDRHALQPGRANVLIELRHDVIETPQQQQAWADRLAPMLETAAEIAGL